MALERETIEKKDFPIGRRGYDPAAVDAHLSTIADQVELMRRTPEQRVEPVATAVSEQVRGIIEAAEKGAQEIQARAQQEARELRAEAVRVAARQREQATQAASTERERAAQQAREYVGRVSQAASQALQRLEGIDGELNTLTDSLGAAADRVRRELEQLQDELEGLSAAAASPVEPERVGPAETQPPPESEFLEVAATTTDAGQAAGSSPAPSAGSAFAPAPAVESESVPAASAGSAFAPAPASEQPVPAPESAKLGDRPPENVQAGSEAPTSGAAVAESPVAEPEAVPEPTRTEDSEGARLVALNMALNGTSREETARYLAENFTLQDRESLLDEVYASVEG